MKSSEQSAARYP